MSDEPNPSIGPPASASSINGLVLNIVLPGLGSLLYGRNKGVGVAQLVMFLVGVLLCITLIGILLGIPLMLAAWIWSIISGVGMMSQGSQPPPPTTPMP